MSNVPGTFGHSISIINRKALAYFSRRLKELELGPGQQAYLLALEPGESVTQEELAKRLLVDKANVSRAVRGIEELGYLCRVRAPDDARAVLLSLTGSGETARRQVEAIAAEWLDQLRSTVSEREWLAAEQALDAIAKSLADRHSDS